MTTGFYFVAFIDILGQRERLSRIKGMPRTDEERVTFSTAISETAGVVRGVRDKVAEWMQSRYVGESAKVLLSSLSPERRDEFAHIITGTVVQTGFSDCFVVAFPLQSDGVDERLSQARASYETSMALLFLCGLFLEALADGIPWRGGIDVGIATEIYPNEIYGPVLLEAYRLESTVAEYPRIVIGNGLANYLAFLERLPRTEQLDEFAAQTATRSTRLICNADDGWPMLDVLSPVVMEASPGLVETRQTAEKWARGQCGSWRFHKNDKLFLRYSRLVRYFEGRK